MPQPITQPPCNGSYITIVASAVDPTRYATTVGDALARYPGSRYLKTAETCSSLRPDLDGSDIYVVYFGPVTSADEACRARSGGPEDAYVRTLSNTVADTHRVQC